MKGDGCRDAGGCRPAALITAGNYTRISKRLADTLLTYTSIAVEQSIGTEHSEVVQSLYNTHTVTLDRPVRCRGDERERIVEVNDVRPASTNQVCDLTKGGVVPKNHCTE